MEALRRLKTVLAPILLRRTKVGRKEDDIQSIPVENFVRTVFCFLFFVFCFYAFAVAFAFAFTIFHPQTRLDCWTDRENCTIYSWFFLS